MLEDFSAKAYKEKLKEKGVFHTDTKLAEIIKDYGLKELGRKPKSVYDPTCGGGSLLSVFDDDIPKYGQELTEDYLEAAKAALKNFTGAVGDTLKDPAFMDMKFDLIVANYPFSIKWEPDKEDVRFKDWIDVPPPSKADYAFIMHMMYLLADDGICVSLNFPGILYRKAREGKIRKELIEKGYIKKVIQVPGGYFEDTNIQTSILILSKEEFKGSIKFVNLAEDLERDVPIDEIAENDYNLSVSAYVQKKIEVEEIDPVEMRESVRNNFLHYVDDGLGLEYFLSKTFGDNGTKMDLLRFYERVLEIVEKYILRLKGQEKSPGSNKSTRT